MCWLYIKVLQTILASLYTPGQTWEKMFQTILASLYTPLSGNAHGNNTFKKRGFPYVDEWQYNIMMVVMTDRKRKDIMSHTTHNSIARPWIFNVNHTRPMLVGGPGVISWMSHRGLRNISSQIDPEVRPCKNSSNAILLAGIYLCLKNIVPNRSKFRPCLGNSFNASIPAGCCPSINVMYECQKLALSALNVLLPRCFNWCHQRTPPIAFSYSQFKTNSGSNFISRNLYMTCILATQSITFYCSNWHILLLRLTRPKSREKAFSNRGLLKPNKGQSYSNILLMI